MIEGNVDAVRKIADFVSEVGDDFKASIEVGYYTKGLDRVHLFLEREEMVCIAEELGVELKANKTSETQEWLYFKYNKVEFGTLVYTKEVEAVIKEEIANG